MHQREEGRRHRRGRREGHGAREDAKHDSPEIEFLGERREENRDHEDGERLTERRGFERGILLNELLLHGGRQEGKQHHDRNREDDACGDGAPCRKPCAAREEDGTEPVAAEEEKQRDGAQRREIERTHRPEQKIGRLRGTAGREAARQQILVRNEGFDGKGNRPGEEGERKRHGQHDDDVPPALRAGAARARAR